MAKRFDVEMLNFIYIITEFNIVFTYKAYLVLRKKRVLIRKFLTTDNSYDQATNRYLDSSFYIYSRILIFFMYIIANKCLLEEFWRGTIMCIHVYIYIYIWVCVWVCLCFLDDKAKEGISSKAYFGQRQIVWTNFFVSTACGGYSRQNRIKSCAGVNQGLPA